MQPQIENPPVAQTATNDQVPANTKSVEIVSKSVEEQGPNIKSEENQANWRAFRERKEADRKAKEEAERRAAEKHAEAEALKAALEAITNKPQRHRQDEVEERDESEDERIQRRVDEAIKKHESEAERRRAEREHAEFPQRINQTYPDFNQICTTENLDWLEYHYPEVAAPYKYLPDNYDKWSSIYKAVKRFMPNPDSKKDQNRAEKNLAKPGSLSSTGTTQGGSAMPAARLDEQRKADNWARMQRTLKGLS